VFSSTSTSTSTSTTMRVDYRKGDGGIEPQIDDRVGEESLKNRSWALKRSSGFPARAPARTITGPQNVARAFQPEHTAARLLVPHRNAVKRGEAFSSTSTSTLGADAAGLVMHSGALIRCADADPDCCGTGGRGQRGGYLLQGVPG